MESWIRKIGCVWPVLWCEKSGCRSGARSNPHPPAHCDRCMVGDREAVFCWVLVFLRLAQCQLIFFRCLMLCGLLVLVSCAGVAYFYVCLQAWICICTWRGPVGPCAHHWKVFGIQMSMWGVTCWAWIQHVVTSYMQNMGNDKRHWNCFNKFTTGRYFVEFCYFWIICNGGMRHGTR